MSKTSVTRLFIGGGIAIVAGAILAIAAVWIAIANDVLVMNGPDIVGLTGGAFAWSLLGLSVVGGLAIFGGLIAGFVAWIAAGARSTLFAATQDIPGGSFVEPGGIVHTRGSPVIATPSRGAQDTTMAHKLWSLSSGLTGTDSPPGLAVAV